MYNDVTWDFRCSSLQGFAATVAARDDVTPGSGNARRSNPGAGDLEVVRINGVASELVGVPAWCGVGESISRALASWVAWSVFEERFFVVPTLTTAAHRLLVQITYSRPKTNT